VIAEIEITTPLEHSAASLISRSSSRAVVSGRTRDRPKVVMISQAIHFAFRGDPGNDSGLRLACNRSNSRRGLQFTAVLASSFTGTRPMISAPPLINRQAGQIKTVLAATVSALNWYRFVNPDRGLGRPSDIAILFSSSGERENALW